MFKLNRTLIKKGFKSIFKTKLFSILMFGMVLISGATYTMLQSSSNSLSSSYKYVKDNGKLADDVIKTNFITENNSAIEVKVVETNGALSNYVDFNEANAIKNQKIVNDVDVSLKLKFITSGSYANVKPTFEQTIKYQIPGPDSFFPLDNSQIFSQKIKSAVEKIKSSITSRTNKYLTKDYVEKLNNNFKNFLIAKPTQSLSVQAGIRNFKVVDMGPTENQVKNINKLVTYKGTSVFKHEKSDKELDEELNKKLSKLSLTPTQVTKNNIKGYKITTLNGLSQSQASVTDYSSYEAVVSPAFANRNNKKIISRKDIDYFLNNLKDDESFADKISNDSYYNSRVIKVDKTPYFIIGIGTTPDFVYPIIDQANPVVDVSNQAIVFVNNRGYERIQDAFRTNPKENYISIKYNKNLSDKKIKEIRKELKSIIRGGKTTLSNGQQINLPLNQWPSNIEPLTSIHDGNDQILLVQERVKFLEDLQSKINTLSYSTTTLLIIFVLSIVIMVFNVLLSINRKTFATLMALGYSKTQIALSNALSSLVLIGLPSLLGYLIGYGMQFLFTGIFDNYWTIPILDQSFSYISFLITGIFPLTLVGLLIAVITFSQLRYTIPDMLKGAAEPAASHLSKMIAKAKYIGIKTKYAIGLSAKNISKILLLVFTSIISMSSLMIGLGTMGNAKMAYDHTAAISKYNFEVDLYSPTIEGGQYGQIKTNELLDLMKNTNNSSETFDSKGDKIGAFASEKGRLHLPSANDGIISSLIYKGNWGSSTNPSKTDITKVAKYLKDLIQTKTLIDKIIPPLSINPWKTASALMPENQKNKAIADYKKTEKLFSDNSPTQKNKISALSKRIVNYEDPKVGDNKNLPYFLTYGQVLINKNDETYTYIDADMEKDNTNFHIKGIKPNSKMFNINKTKLNALENYQSSSNEFPILIDKYLETKYRLSKGDTINFDINNMANRNYRIEKNNREKGQKIIKKAIVIGIVDGYNAEGIYTSQSQANNLLGLDKKKGFNGIFSKNKNPAILSSMPLYSPSGFYLAADTITPKWKPILDDIINKSTSPWMQNFKKNIASNSSEFIKTYSASPFVGATSSVRWKEINKTTFKNVSHISSTIIYIIEIISIVLSLLFTLIVAGLLLTSNRKEIATLWTIGYRKKEIGRIYLSVYILPVLAALAVSIPLSIGILAALKAFVMTFGSILIPFALVWWMPFVAFALIASIFILSTVVTIYIQRQEKALEAFKGD